LPLDPNYESGSKNTLNPDPQPWKKGIKLFFSKFNVHRPVSVVLSRFNSVPGELGSLADFPKASASLLSKYLFCLQLQLAPITAPGIL
jgi:hypothetical protein